MKIVAVSDLHIDIEGKRDHALKNIEQIVKTPAEVLLVGGDTGMTEKGINECLALLSRFPGTKLAFLGNHELKSLKKSTLRNYQDEMSELFSNYGFHLLDVNPFVQDRVGFIGNVCWYDYTLYQGDNKEENDKFQDELFNKIFKTGGITPQELTEICCEKVRQHHSQIVDKCDKIVLGTHLVGFKELLRFDSEFHIRLNAGMGSEKIKELYLLEKVCWAVCGHIHRPGKINYRGVEVTNISSTKDQPYTVKEI
ncbi:metallophosphoesterase [Candidatus Woesearchaeota archaeon]|nr:metallophosphoesterase [Candidatus Woesearchaeota archaeon]